MSSNHSEHIKTETAQLPPLEHAANNEIFSTIMFSNIINVLIVIVFLIWLFRKFNLQSVIAKKREQILETINNLEQERKVKRNHLEKAQNKVKNVKQDVMKIMDEGEHVAESISEKIIADAEQEAREMHKKAHSIIQTERNVASNQLANEVTTAAFVIAEQHIREAIDERLHYKYISEFLDNLDNIKV